MNREQIWAHLNRKYKDGQERATFLYEVFYNRKKLVSNETYNSVHEVLVTPICTEIIFGQLAKQIGEMRAKERKERERPRSKKEKEAAERRMHDEWAKGYDPD